MAVDVITPRQCTTCERWGADSRMTPVTMDAHSHTYYVCSTCIADIDGPGKYQGVSEDDRALARILEYLAGISMEDFNLTDNYQGYAGQFGRHILFEDERGFVDVRTFADSDAATREMHDYENEGFGASEYDGYISYERHGISVSLEGKHVGTYETLRRACAAMSVEMRKTGYFPNVFLCGEHGPTIRRIDVW